MKVGDVVRVVRGDVLERVGYPETMRSAQDKMENEFRLKNGVSPLEFMRTHFPFMNFHSNSEVVKMLVKDYNKNVLKFGGQQRSVYLNYQPELDGTVMQIMNRMTKQTGDYNPSSGYGEDYESAYLSSQKTHLFFSVLPFYNGVPQSIDWSKISPTKGKDIYIEKKNLEFLFTP